MSELNLHETVSGFTEGILGKRGSQFMCFAVCAPLQSLLSCEGIKTELTQGDVPDCGTVWNHVWLTLPDGTIIDPTADQFETPSGEYLPRIYIGKLPEWYQPYERS